MDNLWITKMEMWITFPQCGNVDNSSSYPQGYPQVIHIANTSYIIGLGELSTFPQGPTTTTTNYINNKK